MYYNSGAIVISFPFTKSRFLYTSDIHFCCYCIFTWFRVKNKANRDLLHINRKYIWTSIYLICIAFRIKKIYINTYPPTAKCGRNLMWIPKIRASASVAYSLDSFVHFNGARCGVTNIRRASVLNERYGKRECKECRIYPTKTYISVFFVSLESQRVSLHSSLHPSLNNLNVGKTLNISFG